MQRNLLLALTALLVTTAFIGTAAIPVTADKAGSTDTEGLVGDLDFGFDTNTDDGEANAHGSNQDDDSLIADVGVDGDDETVDVTAESVDDDESLTSDVTMDGDDETVGITAERVDDDESLTSAIALDGDEEDLDVNVATAGRL